MKVERTVVMTWTEEISLAKPMNVWKDGLREKNNLKMMPRFLLWEQQRNSI